MEATPKGTVKPGNSVQLECADEPMIHGYTMTENSAYLDGSQTNQRKTKCVSGAQWDPPVDDLACGESAKAVRMERVRVQR